MSKTLVVVESPAKARTIGRFLGSAVDVLASMGHVRDLPLRELGVHINDDFRPDYELTLNGKRSSNPRARRRRRLIKCIWQPTLTVRGKQSPGTSRRFCKMQQKGLFIASPSMKSPRMPSGIR